MTTLHIIFAVLALVCFIAEAAGVAFGRLNLTALGLALLTAAVLFV
jgi:hypothetical protein